MATDTATHELTDLRILIVEDDETVREVVRTYLEDAGYIEIDKSFLGRKPLTRARLTRAGRKAFRNYLEAIGKLVADGDT